MNGAAVLGILILAATAGLSVLSVVRRPADWASRLPALLLFLLSLALGLQGLVHASPLLSLRLAEGRLAFSVGPWNGFWVAAVAILAAATGLVLHASRHPTGTWVAWGWTLLAADAVLTAASPLALVAGWGILALGVYALVMGGATRDTTIRAAWVMLVINEMGAVLLLLGAIILLVYRPLSQDGAIVVGLLGVIGLGAKAGIFPFQLWLPVTEPEAPGSVAGMLSGTLTMVAMLAVWRWLSWLPASSWHIGWILVALGLVGALLGMIHAVVERDYKRVLAYSTAEWMGVGFLLLGLMLVFRGAGMAPAGSLAEDAFFVLILMHGASKLAAFVASEWVERATATRNLNELGGLFRMAAPVAAVLAFPLAALMAIPPTGGYVSEWMLVESIFMSDAGGLRFPLILVAIPLALVLAGGATAMLRWYGSLFLGPVRRPAARHPSYAYTAAVVVGTVMAWGAGVGVAWFAPWIAGATPRVGPGPLSPLLGATFTARPGAASILIPLGAKIFSGMPGTPGVILFPGPAFTVTSPWDLLWFGGAIVAAAWAVREIWLRRRRVGQARVVAPWAGGTAYQTSYAWSGAGLTHPLRLAFAPVIGLRRSRAVSESRLHVQVDAVDRLVEQGFGPFIAAARWVSRALQGLQDGDLSHYLGIMLGTLLTLLVVLKLVGIL